MRPLLDPTLLPPPLLTVARESYGFLELLKRVGSGTQELAPNFMLVVFVVLVKTLCPTSTEDGERSSVQPVSYSDASATRNKLVGEAIQSLFLQNAINTLANKCAVVILFACYGL